MIIWLTNKKNGIGKKGKKIGRKKCKKIKIACFNSFNIKFPNIQSIKIQVSGTAEHQPDTKFHSSPDFETKQKSLFLYVGVFVSAKSWNTLRKIAISTSEYITLIFNFNIAHVNTNFARTNFANFEQASFVQPQAGAAQAQAGAAMPNPNANPFKAQAPNNPFRK